MEKRAIDVMRGLKSSTLPGSRTGYVYRLRATAERLFSEESCLMASRSVIRGVLLLAIFVDSENVVGGAVRD